MKNKLLIFLIVICIVLGTSSRFILAENVTITQIDSSTLLPLSKIDTYISLTDAVGNPVDNPNYSLFRLDHEKSVGYQPARILNIEKNGLSNTEITFLLVLDNSGSMYKKLGNGETGTRMDHAKKAVKDFLHEIRNTGTRVGLAVFNTRYSLLIEPDSDIDPVIDALGKIRRPDRENAFTELYYAIDRSAFDMSKYMGRKAVILLSDGQNYPYYEKSGKPNPEIGTRIYTPKDALISMQKEGVALYGINFSNQKDPALSSIVIKSGGTVYDATNDVQLLNIYKLIKNRIAEEIRITVRVPVVFIETPMVRVKYNDSSDAKGYYAPLIMGTPDRNPMLFAILAFILAIIVWIILVIIHFEHPVKYPEITMLKYGAGKPLQRTIALSSQKTVIGNSPEADFTVAGIPKMKESHAEIIKDEKTGSFTIVSDEDIMVNNRPTKKRKLKPGDVINVEGATIIFDSPEK